MAKKATKVQIVDLGTHFLKAALCDVGDGPVTISKAAAVPVLGVATEPDAYLGEVSQAFDGLADFFDKKVPIYFLGNESLIHVGISYLNNLEPSAIDSAIEADRQKFLSSGGGSAYDQLVSRSFRLREKPQGKNKQVVLANAFSKIDHMDQIFDMVNNRKLTWGGYYPRLFGYNELFRTAYGAEIAAAVGCVVDVGFKSTSIVAFKDANIVFHKVLHLGAFQIYQEMYNIDPKLQMDLFSLVAIMQNHGFDESEETLTNLGLPLGDPGKYQEVILSERDQLFTKIQLSIDYFSTVAATDFNTSMSTVMSVRKGPEKIVFLGGVAASPGFMDAATQYFQTAEVLDPARICSMGANSTKTELPPHFFALAAAGAQMAVNSPPDYNMGDRYKPGAGKAKGGGAAAAATAGPTGEPFAPSWAILVALLAVCGIMYRWWDLSQQLKKVQAEAGASSAQVQQNHDTMAQYVTQRVLEAQTRVRLEYVDELVKPKVDWPKLFNDLLESQPDGVKIYRLTVETQMPTGPEQANNPNDPGADDHSKVITFKLCGESIRREGITEFVQKLEHTKHFTKMAAPDISQVPEGSSSGSGCQDPDATNVDWLKHFDFQITGNLTY